MKHFITGILLLAVFVSCYQKAPSNLQATHLACEWNKAPLGIETTSPALSWQIVSDECNVRQTAYRVLVADSPEQLSSGEGNCWDSGKIRSDNSLQVFYAGVPLRPATTYYWKVKVWDNHENESGWSEPAGWQTGLFSPEDWKGAAWIALQELPEEKK